MTPRERFLRYVTYYTTSDDFSETAPSTERQKELIRELAREMEELGLKDISFDSNSNVYGTLPANVKGAPSIALIAHVDTAPDAPGENVRPAVIICPEGEFTLESGVVMNEALCPGLSKHVGEELIVTDGTTLLGADDKAGVAEIMSAVDRLMESGRPHGEVKVIFTTDEEVGRGAEGIDVKALGCDFGYTVDGGPIGEIEYENFNAASAVLTVHGVGVHPGEAKDVMVNAATVAIEFHDMLPQDRGAGKHLRLSGLLPPARYAGQRYRGYPPLHHPRPRRKELRGPQSAVPRPRLRDKPPLRRRHCRGHRQGQLLQHEGKDRAPYAAHPQGHSSL